MAGVVRCLLLSLSIFGCLLFVRAQVIINASDKPVINNPGANEPDFATRELEIFFLFILLVTVIASTLELYLSVIIRIRIFFIIIIKYDIK